MSSVSFSAPAQYTVAEGAESVAVADFNGDHKSDLVVATNGTSTVSVLLGNGDGTFGAAQNFGAGGVPESVVVGDLNGDGKTDLVVTDTSNLSVGVLLGNGDGTFQTAKVYAVGSDPEQLALGEFNGDGKTDVVVGNILNEQNDVSVLLGNGDGTLQAAQNFPVGNAVESLAVGDFNADGKSDVIVSIGSTVSELLGNGDGTFQTERNIGSASPDSAVGVTVGDLNGDGKPDVAVANPIRKSVSVLLNAIELSAAAVNLSSIAGAPSSGPVATFTNAYPSVSGVSYSATIDWGDGSVSPGIVTGSGILTVSGSHTYADPGMDAVTVVIAGNSRFPATATVHSTATVVALGQSVQNGLTGDIGFWHSKNGQTLIKGFNGGSSSTALSSWLVATFPNLYGAGAGANNLIGQTDTQVAAFYKTQFALPGSNVEAQVLATALNVYATTLSLGGTSGQAYGFTVSANGLGADSFSVGADGAAFGVAKKTTRNVLELLKAVDHQTVLGVLYDGDPTFQKMANHLLHVLNEAGSIS